MPRKNFVSRTTCYFPRICNASTSTKDEMTETPKHRQESKDSLRGEKEQKEMSAVVKAHSFANQAEEARHEGRWEEAIELYQQASELFLIATNHTSDVEASKANDLEKQLRMFNQHSPSNHEHSVNTTIPQHIPNQHTGPAVIHVDNVTIVNNEDGSNAMSTSYEGEHSMPDASIISGSQNYFLGQSPAHSTDEILLYPPQMYQNNVNRKLSSQGDTYSISQLPVFRDSEEATPEEERSPLSDIWNWVEKMLEILPLPITNFGATYQRKTSDTPVAESTLMNSFYVVPERMSPPICGGENAARPMPGATSSSNTTYHSDVVSDGKNQMKQMELEIKQLKETVARLSAENASLRNAFQQHGQVERENDLLKKSIVQFRTELQKKANQLRQSSMTNSWITKPSSSVGNLPTLLKQLPNDAEVAYQKKNKELESQLVVLTRQLKEATDKNKEQAKIIEKYELRWASLKEEARRRRRNSESTSPKSVHDSVSGSEVNLSMIERSEKDRPDRMSETLFYSTSEEFGSLFPNKNQVS